MMNKLQEIVASQSFNLFLVDVAGVLYNSGDGLIQGTARAIKELQSHADLFLMTNNSWKSPVDIQRWCARHDLSIAKDHIITSGLGVTYDKTVMNKINEKKVFILGGQSCLAYLEGLSCHRVQDPVQADVFLIMAWPPEEKKEIFDRLVSIGKKTQPVIICCNPDRYIMLDGSYYPVAGFWAERLGKAINQKVLWMGKPHKNFSEVVKKYLSEKHNKILDNDSIFFDDNPENVSAVSRHLGIQTCLVKDTGLAQNMTMKTLKKSGQDQFDWVIGSLTL